MKEAGKGLPEFSDDDVVDYLVTEAVVLKAQDELEEARKIKEKEMESKNFRKGHKKLANQRG